MEGPNRQAFDNRTNKNAGHKSPANAHDSKSQLNELRLLKYSFIQIMVMKEFDVFKGSLKSSNPLVNTNGLIGIAQKYDNYANMDEFLLDLTALVRSYTIHFANEPGVQIKIDKLSEHCHRDVKNIRSCAECFERWAIDPDHYFTHACARPHLIIYAQLDVFPYWPAKVMLLNDNTANVVFFGDHTQADVPLDNCILYTKSYNFKNDDNNTDLANALMELDDHINKVEMKFGLFVPAELSERLSKEHFGKQLKTMFPGAFASKSNEKSTAKQNLPEKSQTSGKFDEAVKCGNFSDNSCNSSFETNKPIDLTDGTEKQLDKSQLKRKSEESTVEGSAAPMEMANTNLDSRSDVVPNDIQMQCSTMSRRIVELEDEKNQLAQELKDHKAKIEKLNEELIELKECQYCITCDEKADHPYFCDEVCKKLYEDETIRSGASSD